VDYLLRALEVQLILQLPEQLNKESSVVRLIRGTADTQQGRCKDHADDSHQFHEDVESRAGRILQRVPDRVTNDGSRMEVLVAIAVVLRSHVTRLNEFFWHYPRHPQCYSKKSPSGRQTQEHLLVGRPELACQIQSQ